MRSKKASSRRTNVAGQGQRAGLHGGGQRAAPDEDDLRVPQTERPLVAVRVADGYDEDG